MSEPTKIFQMTITW